MRCLGLAWVAAVSGQLTYQKGDEVKSLLTKVYPFNNPHETYRYYDTPLGCGHDSPVEESHSISEVREDAVLHNVLTTEYSVWSLTVRGQCCGRLKSEV